MTTIQIWPAITFLLATFLKVFPHCGHGSSVDRCDSAWFSNFFLVSKLVEHWEQENCGAAPECTFRWSFKSRGCLKVFRQTSHAIRSPEKCRQIKKSLTTEGKISMLFSGHCGGLNTKHVRILNGRGLLRFWKALLSTSFCNYWSMK